MYVHADAYVLGCVHVYVLRSFFFSLFLFIYLFIIVSTIGSLASMLRDAINANVCADYTIRASIVQIAEMLDFLDHLMEIGVLYFLSIKWWDVVLHVVIILVVRSIRSVISWCSVLRCDLIVFFWACGRRVSCCVSTWIGYVKWTLAIVYRFNLIRVLWWSFGGSAITFA